MDIVSRNYYDLSCGPDVIVSYNINDEFTNKDSRTFSCWFKLNEYASVIKNIKEGLSVSLTDDSAFISVKLGTKFKKGDDVIIKRGIIKIPGKVIGANKISVNVEQIKKLNRMNKDWYNVTGFAITKEQTVTLLKSDNMSLSIKGCCFISITINGTEKLIQLSKEISTNEWLGLIISLNQTISVDIFNSINGLKNIESISSIKNDLYTQVKYNNPYIPKGECNITNIRLCTGIYNDTDSKIQELISYHVKDDSQYLINDDAMTFLNKNFMGDQR